MSEVEEKNILRGITRPLKCFLTNPEKLQLGQQLAELGSEIDNLNNDLLTVKAQYQAQIKEKTAAKERVQTLLIAGSETRSVACIANLHTPREGQKTIIRLDTGDTVEVVAMTHQELQGSFRFEDGSEGEPGSDDPEAEAHEDGEGEAEESDEPAAEATGDFPQPDADGLYPFEIAEPLLKKVGVSYVKIYLLQIEHGYLWGWEAKAGAGQPQKAFLGANPHSEQREGAIQRACEDVAEFLKRSVEDAKPTDQKALRQVMEWLQELYESVTNEPVAAE